MAYGDFDGLARRTASSSDKTFNVAKKPKYDGYQWSLASMVYKFFDKKPTSLADKSVSGNNVTTLSSKSVFNNKIKQNWCPLDLATQELAEELHKPVIRKFLKRTVYSTFKDNIWSADIADM